MPNGIANNSRLAGVFIKLRMEREVTAVVTENEPSCEASLTTEYAANVIRGDKTAGD